MRLTCQLYTVRDQLAEDYVGTLRQLKSIGLEYIEGAGNYGGASATEGRKILDDLGLKVSGSHVPVSELEGDLDKTIEHYKTLGCPYIIVPWVDAATYEAGWDKFARRLEPIGAKLKEAGLSLAYHNHDFEFKTTADGQVGLDLFYQTADPSLVKAELDLAWVHIGGADPAEYLRKLKGRAPLVHLKDYDPTQTPRWRPAGQGVLDWDACLAAAEEVGVEFGGIELDESPGSPIDAVRASFEYFAARGLK